MRHRIGRPRFMQSFAAGGSGQPFTVPAAIDISVTPGGGIQSTNVQAALMELDAEKVAKAGDTMTGFLVLNAPPVLDLQAATKKYVDDKVAAGGGYTDEMAMDAVAAMIKNGTNITWAYDDVLNSLTPTVNVTNMAAGSVGFTPAGNVGSNNVQAAIQELDNEKVAKAGDTMSGGLTLGLGGTGSGSGWLTLNGGSTGLGGGIISLQKNSVNTWHVGHASIVLGTPGVDDIVFYGVASGFQLRLSAATGQLSLSSNIPSTSTTTGALTVAGGVGIQGAANVGGAGSFGGNVTVNGGTVQIGNGVNTLGLLRIDGAGGTTSGSQILFVVGGAGKFVMGNASSILGGAQNDDFLFWMSNASPNSAFRINAASSAVAFGSTVPSTSPTTGAVTVAGGVGIAGALFTGGILVIAKATPIFYMNDLGGAGNYISAQRNGLTRWEMSLGSGSESGSNAGSDFVLNRYNDAGSLLGSAIVIRRNNGDMTVGGGFVVQAADPTMYFQKAADANVAQMYVMSSGAARWLWHYADQTNNNMQLYRCNAAGGIVDGPFGVNWATGKVAMSSNIPATSSTTGTLTVAGGLGVGGNIYAGAMIHSPSGITVSPSLPDTNHSMTFDATVNGPFIAGFQGVALGIQTVKYLTITGSGEMNLGTAVPGYKFGMTFPGGGVQYGFGIKQSADTTVAIQFINAAGTPMGNISTGSAAVAYNTSSDKRLKKNLKKFDSNKIIDKIEVYDFEWKSSGERGLGVIAQDVYEVYPQAITHDERDDNWFVDYSKFAPLMLQELKSLRSRVKRLER